MAARPKLSTEDILRICKLYMDGKSSTEIARQFSVSHTAVLNRLKQNGIWIRSNAESSTKYSLDEHFFDIIDLEKKAYWLGFIFADGYVCKNKTGSRSLAVTLSAKDLEHVNLFARDILSSHPIHVRKYDYMRASIYIRSSVLCDALEKYDVVPNKTMTIRFPPNGIPNPLIRDFIRGYVDGDGGFYKNSSVTKSGYTISNPTFSVTGNIEFVSSMQLYLMEMCKLNKTKLDVRHKDNPGIVTMRYVGRKQVGRIANYLYDNSSTYMKRKRDVALSI